MIVVVTIGIILLIKYHKYTGYTVNETVDISNSEENTEYYVYGNGYLKCAGDGVTCFNSRGVVWSESYSMLQPVTDVCGDYIAVADMGQRNLYLYDRSGFINRISVSHSITDVEVSRAGVVAIASNDGNINYIELKDRKGGEIMTEKSVFSSSGYLMDLSMSEDGSRLAAVFVSVDRGSLTSRVVFYDLTGDAAGSDIIAGTFTQYEGDLLTSVQFMENDMVGVVGDTAMSIYQFREAPELLYENREMNWEIETLFWNGTHIGMITEEPDRDTRYVLKVFDTSGNVQLDLGTDFPYTRVFFAGNNVVLYSYSECQMYSLAGVQKLDYPFDRHIEALLSPDGRHFVYGTNSLTEFITLN